MPRKHRTGASRHLRNNKEAAMDIFSAATVLFLVMDPLGNIPIFLSVLERVAPERRLRVLVRELLLAFFVLLGFLFFGHYVLGFLGLSPQAIRIAGGIILFLIALKMVFPVPRSARDTEEEEHDEPLLVPLAIPLVAGPSAMAILMLLSTKEPERMLDWVSALTIAWVITAVILLSASGLQRFLGRRGLIAMERLMGMILIALAVQMLLEGVSGYLASGTGA
jgi:multiple antibiotic resistance protein